MHGRKYRTAGRVLPLAAALGLCLCQVQAQPGPAAKVLTLTGQVSLLRDGSPWALKTGDLVLPRQIIITGPDGMAAFQVSDGSTFHVFPDSRVMFRASPSNWTDLLDLLIGRIKVEIQKLGNQPNPNTVRTPTAVISVRGTIFDVVVEEDTDATFVSVDEGLVEVRNQTAPGKSRLLYPGDSIRVLRNVPLAKSIDKGSVAHGAIRAAMQAMYEVLLRTSHPGAGGVPGGGTPGQGDTPKPDPPSTPPPPAPEPPATAPPAAPPPSAPPPPPQR